MAEPKYRTPEYRAARKRIDQAQARGEWLTCVQGWHGSSGDCLHPTRDISPTDAAHVAHDDAGTTIIGASHALCNVTDGGQRRHAAKIVTHWPL
jgi:hypothetical protein